MDLQKVKQRFGIIGNYIGLNRAMEHAIMVAPTDLSVLITGKAVPGKSFFQNHPPVQYPETRPLYCRELRGHSRGDHRFRTVWT